MDGLNRVCLLGNLGADPELAYGQQGTAVLRLRLATTTSYMSGQERKEQTDWHSAVVFGKRAEGLSKVLRKGGRLYLEGRLQTRSYDKDGEKRYRTDVVGEHIILLDGKPAEGPPVKQRDMPYGAPTDSDRAQQYAAMPRGGAIGPDVDDDDGSELPF